MSGVNEIRQSFLDFFKGNGHAVLPSSSLVPTGDPTLMFTNAGMVQFKNVFTGLEKRPYQTAASSQKCVRAGGKHNDLDNVGYTARHHTFFEMLGNFSFGDYFKEQAILYAWELLTKDYGLSPERLTATVFYEDTEAYKLWKKISGLPEERIIKIATHDNFWAMGETGPCGPCSEIFYDHGDHLPGTPPGTKDEDLGRFVEIWNLVFMQFDQVSPDQRNDLPKPSIDTGMGLERLAAVLQGTHDNYEIDTFKALIEASEHETGVAAEGKHKASHRVIADHIRAVSFLIAGGVLPSNEGRGYVLRRIMRRAMRHGHILGNKDLLLHKLVPTLVREMGQAYPELGRAEALIRETLKLEEARFHDMLGKGLKLLSKARQGLPKGKPLPGDVAFKLYDTYGFPLDLTEDAMKSEGLSVDTKAFEEAMAKQKAQARAAWKGSGDAATDEVWFDIKDEVGASEFLGYETERAEALVVAITRDGKRVKSAKKGEKVAIICNQTPFYGESGGQIGDTGTLSGAKSNILITDTQKKLDNLVVHLGEVKDGSISVGDAIHLKVDHQRRLKIRANHSVTHLLHKAMRKVLGDHVTQKGSLVAEDHLRFDVSHPKQISRDELDAIEGDVNAQIRRNTGVMTHLMEPEEAIKAGALALFGEKYGDEVRVVQMGTEDGATYSVELCGGTHVRATGDIGLFKITHESAIAAGVRRIEGLTGQAALDYVNSQEASVRNITAALKAAPHDVLERVEALLIERKTLDEALKNAKKALALGGGGSSLREITKIGNFGFIGEVLKDVSPGDLRGIADGAKTKVGSGVVAYCTVIEGKAGLLVGVTKDLAETINAVELLKLGVAELGGQGGGGRPDMAQGGGPDGSKAKEALKAIENHLKNIS